MGKCLQKIREEGSTVVLIAPHWQTQAWLPALLELVVEDPLLLPRLQNLLMGPLRQQPSANQSGEAPAGRLESVRGCYTATGLSQQAADLLVAGWSQGTNTAYESGWRHWTSWCESRHVDPFSGGIQPFLDFVGDLFAEGLQYRTINTIHSAISMTHDPIENLPSSGEEIDEGYLQLKAPQPRYSNTWEVSRVLRYLSGLGANSSLSLKVLSGKLALLMALVTASRTLELLALDLRYRVFKPEGVLP